MSLEFSGVDFLLTQKILRFKKGCKSEYRTIIMNVKEETVLKTLTWTGPEKMEIQEDNKPTPKPNEVLIRVLSVGICGSELSGYLGENSLRKPPLIMGHEFCGVVEALGGDVEPSILQKKVVVNPLISCGKCAYCRNGQDNLCQHFKLIGAHQSGAFAEWVSVPERACFVVDDALDARQGSLVEPLACGLRAIRLGNVNVTDNVIIFGAGIIGLSALKVAKLSGANEIVVVDMNKDRLKIAENWGATKTVQPADEDILDFCHDLTDGIGMDVAIDAVGVPVTRQNSIAVSRKGGRIVLIGLHSDKTELSMNDIARTEKLLLGSFAYTYKDFQDALTLVENGIFEISDDWLDERSLEKGDTSFQELIAGSSFAKIVLKP